MRCAIIGAAERNDRYRGVGDNWVEEKQRQKYKVRLLGDTKEKGRIERGM